MDTIDPEQGEVLLWIPPYRPRPRGVTELLLVSLLLVALVVMACDTERADGPTYLAVYEVEVANQETFYVAVATKAQMATADARLASQQSGIVHGSVVRGDGGFNDDYDWHLAPESITFPDLTMEVCDGRPASDVQADIPYWADTIGYYCPWGARFVRRVT